VRRRVTTLFVWLAAVVAAGPAAANGAFPDSDALLLPADRPQQIILSTNFGLIISNDGGGSWQWTCERAATSMATAYALGAPPDDRLYSRSVEVGLAISSDDSCSWRRAGGALATAIVSDYFPDPTDAGHVLAIVGATGDGGPGVYESRDGGDTFAATPLFVARAGDELLGVEIARSDPRVIYLSLAAPGPRPMLARSGDAGATWQMLDVEPSLGARRPFIIAIDPEDADVVTLRVIGAGVELLAVSRDGGASFATPITLAGGALSGFARLASGTVLVAGLVPGDGGTTTSGVAWRSGDGGRSFGDWTLAPAPRIRALAERGGALFIAGDNYMDGWALATSSDEGRTLQPILRYDQVGGVKACVAAACQDLCDEQAGRGIWEADVCWPAGDAGADAGPPPGPPSGCGCGAAPASRDASGLAAALLFASFAAATARARSAARGRCRGTACCSPQSRPASRPACRCRCR
jgi:hypothetical protein